MKFWSLIILTIGLASAGFFLFSNRPTVIEITGGNKASGTLVASPAVSGAPEAIEIKSAVSGPTPNLAGDLEYQDQLPNPPEVVKAIYSTAWVAGSEKGITRLIKLIDETELNAIVIDIKDYSGYISYGIDDPQFKSAGALDELRILKPNALIKRLHDRGIYVIARISTFQDSILAKAHPEWALKNKTTGTTWKDNKGLAWMDAASQEVWDYNVALAKDALARGFDEVNFDYVRFPSDGSLKNIEYPYWDGIKEKHLVIRDFFKYLRDNLGEAKLSADLFGLVTVAVDDLGIGQKLEDALPYFDFVAPMVYPSHYAKGVFGFASPAEHPYEVIKNSFDVAMLKIRNYEFGYPTQVSSTSSGTAATVKVKLRDARAKLRPWLQDFDLGATYDAAKVRAQIQASDEAGGVGWMLWDPKNLYTKDALLGA